jgi:hypothetical protein
MTASVQLKKKSGRESQGAWRQDELFGGKPQVVKWLWLSLSVCKSGKGMDHYGEMSYFIYVFRTK